MLFNAVEEFRKSDIVRRGYDGLARRSDRYITREAGFVGMIPAFKNIIEDALDGKSIDIKGIIDKATPQASKYFKRGYIAKCDDYIVVFFSNVPGLDMCGLRLTYNTEEFYEALRFLSKFKKEGAYLLSLLSLDYCFKMQMTLLFKQMETNGVLYQFSGERHKPIDLSVIRIIWHEDDSELDDAVINAVNSALIDREVPIEELNMVLPDDVAARLYCRKYTQFELSQIEYLERHAYMEA